MSEPQMHEVTLTLTMNEAEARLLLETVNHKDFRIHLLQFLTPWRDTRVFIPTSLDKWSITPKQDLAPGSLEYAEEQARQNGEIE